MAAWSATFGLVNKDGNRLELTHSYKLEELVHLAQEHNHLKNVKTKFVVTWILSDVPNILETYINRGYALEKMSIKR